MILTGAVLFCYLVFLAMIFSGWSRAVRRIPLRYEPEQFISIVLPVRNEERNIRRILEDLVGQQYAGFEIIVVDDDSNDNTAAIIRDFHSPFVKSIQAVGSGKKSALATGIAIASGRIIATTDADCSVPSTWLQAINSTMAGEGTVMAVGPVAIAGDGTLFSRMQQLEFAALTGTAGAMAARGTPVTCNGANLAFRKDLYNEVGGYDGNFHIASGDDEFLMRKFISAGGSIRFMGFQEGVVRTIPARTLGEFLQQRIRWAGKWKHNSSAFAKSLAVFIAAVQLATVFSFFKFFQTLDAVWLLFILVRALAECVVLKRICAFLRIRMSLAAFSLLVVFYPFYVLFVAILSFFQGYEWRGRTYGNT